jgi:hypothetical protein
MKLISKNLLVEYGFKEGERQPTLKGALMTRDKFTVVLKEDGNCCYTNLGIDYPLSDLAALKKLYKEVRSKELTEVKN